MATVSQTTLLHTFSWMKMLEFRSKFHWSSFLRVQLTKFQHWFRSWLDTDQATSHYRNQGWLDYRRIYVSLGFNEFKLHTTRDRWASLQYLMTVCNMQGLYSLSGKTSYCKISWSLETARFGFGLYQSLWNFTGTSAALLPRCLSNFRAIRLL